MSVKVAWFFMAPFFVWWRAFVLVKLWTWFIVPLGVRPISTALAAGLSLTIGWLTLSTESKEGEPETDWGKAISTGLLMPPLLWGIAAIIHAFV